MEIYLIKSNDDTVYFQLENCPETNLVLNHISKKLFDCDEFVKGFDEKEKNIKKSEWHSYKNIFSNVVIDDDYIYLVIKGLEPSLKDEIIYYVCDVHNSTINNGRHSCVKVVSK